MGNLNDYKNIWVFIPFTETRENLEVRQNAERPKMSAMSC